MPGVSIHVVDVARGVVAAGMRVELHALAPPRLIADGVVGANGLLAHAALDAHMPAGPYEARFHVAAFYRTVGVALPDPPFLDVVSYRFGIADPQQHYHLPMKLTPWGLSCFRGGA
ncbi:MAG: hydroxyisourate hydrolase [Burkholderiaceae bacterium]|jgi:5-hydroxyisourate hydrolase|nr:hydroxyisourate hydrolase [Burkholderiaceae bacterium]